MIIVIALRNGEAHIVNYTMNNGKNYRTICSKTFSKTLQMNTFAADNTFPGTCQTCKAYYDEMYISDLNEMPSLARNGTQFKYYDLPELHHNEFAGPQAKHENTMNRQWYKLVKYQRLLQKRPYGQ